MLTENCHYADKRKIEPFDTLEEPRQKKRKKSEIKKAKPPTAEEISHLRETENVFHSNLFRLQIEEMLREIKLKESTYNQISAWIDKLKDFLLNIDFSFSVKLPENQLENISNVLLPMKSDLIPVTMTFTFVKPKSVNISGSFASKCILRKTGNIDVIVEMPKETFQKEDYLNEKYLRKRSIYLTCLASKLIECVDNGLLDPDIQYALVNSIDKPSLRVKPAEKKLNKYSVFIHLVVENGTFKETRFLPNMNNVRYGWFFDTTGAGKLNTPTPYYNSLICQDIVILTNEEVRYTIFNENPNLKDAYLLLKVWLHQRKLDEGLGSFSGFLLAMFMVYLFKNRKLNRLMSSYQIIRTVWLALDQTNWHMDGISLAHVKNGSNSDISDTFKSNYDVIFIDVTGQANLASTLSLPTYLYLKNQSKNAVECLDDSKHNHFPALFMTPVLITREFDHIIHFKKLSCIRETVKQNVDIQMQLDLRSDSYTQFLKIIYGLLKRSLKERVSQICYNIVPHNLTWSINENTPLYGNIIVGFKINPEHAYDVIDRGPTANLPEAAEFRKFWGTKSELRRFRDGDVCETVCWAKTSDTLQKKRLIIREIVHYILNSKLQIQPDQYLYIADQCESVVYNNFNKIFSTQGTGEEATIDILNSFLDLSKKLRSLKDIPLEITSVQGSSAVFRYSDLFPPLPNTHTKMKSLTSTDTAVVFKCEILPKHIPLYIAPIEVVIQFSSSNKWPVDVDVIRKLQAAFYLKLSSSLKACKYLSQPYNDRIDILKDGYVFRVRICNNNEIAAVKRQIDEKGIVQYCDNAESLYLERTLMQLPVLTSSIHGLHQLYPSLGPSCAMTKRWLRSQLMDEYYFSDICIDLIMSYLFLNPQPYTPSYQPQVMFFRFLKLISSTEWFTDPIIVNFNDELTKDEILEVDYNMNKNRSNMPPLIIITPFDKSGTKWTSEQPSLIILKRLAVLADATLKVIDASLLTYDCDLKIQQIFRPPLKGYDILIWTIPTVNSSRWFSVDADSSMLTPVKNEPKLEKLPILDFHPVRLYVEELRKHYIGQCLFFYDFYGGNFIGVVLKPEAKLTKDFKVSNMNCSKLDQGRLSLDIEGLIEDFRILGDGLVSCIEKCSENICIE